MSLVQLRVFKVFTPPLSGSSSLGVTLGVEQLGLAALLWIVALLHMLVMLHLLVGKHLLILVLLHLRCLDHRHNWHLLLAALTFTTALNLALALAITLAITLTTLTVPLRRARCGAGRRGRHLAAIGCHSS